MIPLNNCVGQKFLSKDLVIYGYRVYVRWSGEGFGDCNDVLFMPEELNYNLLFAPSRRVPVIASILYSKPDIVEKVRGFVVHDVREFVECIFNNSELLSRDLIAMDLVPTLKGLLEDLENEGELPFPRYEVRAESIYESLLSSSRALCGQSYGLVEEVSIGPEFENISIKEGVRYSISGNLLWLSDGINHVFVDLRDIDPFEIGDTFILIVYGIYGSRELTHIEYMGDETIEHEALENLVKEKLNDIVREDGMLRGPSIIARKLLEIKSQD